MTPDIPSTSRLRSKGIIEYCKAASLIKSKYPSTQFLIIGELKDDEKCPPWTLLASDMTHDNKKKTIYYENAVIKNYDIPIFYLP